MKAFLALVTLATSAFAGTQLVEWDPHLQLVCDERVVASYEGLTLVPGVLTKDEHNPLFQADHLWENALNNLYPNVHYDAEEGRFHLWYKCVLNDKDVIARLAPVRTIHDQGWLLLHAVSKDAVTWTKPDHGLVEFDGNAHNNAVARDTPNAGVCYDAHDADPQRRYKMIYDEGLAELRVRFSPDGIHWSEPVKPEGFGKRAGDTHTNAFWDPASQRYVCFTKHSLGERLVARYESDDFLHWRGGDIVLRSSPEEGKNNQTYCLEVFPYGSGYLGYAMMYHANGDHAVDCELAYSPDTVHWKRLFPGHGFVPHGAAAGTYDSMCIYGPAGKAISSDGHLLVLYGGSATPHVGWKRHCLPCLARLGLDRWCGYTDHSEAGGSSGKGGALLTHSLKLTGETLCVTADAQGGHVRVTLVDGKQQSHAADSPLESSATRAPVHFPGFSVEEHRGESVTLRFEIQNATLYALAGVE